MTAAKPKKAKPEPKPMGRPSSYTHEIAEEICERLAKGEPLAEICRIEDMPKTRTVSDWKRAHEGFAADFARARDEGYDAIAFRTRATARGRTTVDGGDSSGDVQRDKLIIETDLKLLARWDPRRYGDKVALVGGGADDAPIQLSDNQTAARIAALLDAARQRKPDGEA